MNKYIVLDVSLTCFRSRDLKWEVCGHATAHTRKIGFNQKSFLVKVMQHIEYFISFLTFHRPHTKPKKHLQIWYSMQWGLFFNIWCFTTQTLLILFFKISEFYDVVENHNTRSCIFYCVLVDLQTFYFFGLMTSKYTFTSS